MNNFSWCFFVILTKNQPLNLALFLRLFNIQPLKIKTPPGVQQEGFYRFKRSDNSSAKAIIVF